MACSDRRKLPFSGPLVDAIIPCSQTEPYAGVQMPTPPSGTVTMLFTDIEGSTRQLQRLGERYPKILATHQQLLRAAFQTYDGYEVQTQGDSFFVAFARAGDALQVAIAAQRALAAHPWPDGAVVRVRMGLHTGEPIWFGNDYTGLDVHRAARLAA